MKRILMLCPLTVLLLLVPIFVVCQTEDRKHTPREAQKLVADDKNTARTCKKGHRSRMDVYKEMRMLPPLRVTSVEGNTVYYSISDEVIVLGSLEIEPDYSVLPKDFPEKHSGCYGFIFCAIHLKILRVQELDKKQCGESP